MPHLKLKLVSVSVIGQKTSCSFTESGGSIGRAEQCDWTLHDVDRFISKTHLVISFKNQQFVLTDVSSNGVIINNNAPLGRNNECVLQLSDMITVGQYSIQVEDLSVRAEEAGRMTPAPATPPAATQGDSDLLGLVTAGTETPAEPNIDNFLKASAASDATEEQSTDSGLGLHEIISGTTAQNQSKPIEQNPFKTGDSEQNPFITDGLNTPGSNSHVVTDGLIPDDWEFMDSAAPIEHYKSPSENSSFATPQGTPSPFSDTELPDNPFSQSNYSGSEVASPIEDDSQVPETSSIPMTNPADTFTPEMSEIESDTPPIMPEPISEPILKPEPLPASNKVEMRPSSVTEANASGATTHDAFFTALYTKLGLPKEYISTIDADTFADDIVTILLSTTKGLMALLSSRTAFKQESRLSSTLIQPRSNNPIKFSIDPVDTLEMLLLKKKKGYMSTQASYDEAMEDIQLHQMAFMSGLQATLEGVLNQLDPAVIEKQINAKGKGLMGLNSNSQCWQLYKGKQQELAKTVTENLNEVLGSYFSEAYQAQINSFKNEK